jgi:hypothetical protein
MPTASAAAPVVTFFTRRSMPRSLDTCQVFC